MEEKVTFCLDLATEKMNEAVSHLNMELSKIRAGRANTSVLDGIMVDYYGTPTAINSVASLNTPDARTILIQPWEKNIISEIVNAINTSNLGFVAQDTGDKIIINIPILTEERRKDLVKQVKIEVENCKISIRNARREANDELKKLLKSKDISEDDEKKHEKKIQEVTDQNIKKIDEKVTVKENEIMKI